MGKSDAKWVVMCSNTDGNTGKVVKTYKFIADGSVVKAYTTKISEVNIGGEVVKDVECDIMPQTDATPLLGMNVLHKFGNFRIDSKQNLLILKE